ncbi:MAG: hypothetical protein J07AB43_10220 [Candidatus Nanosalina sp. J07AB43]|jgi:hypothetical protein|nr:MAG: hypothetical protein J07AB43_10220 [Candidatus Nanosalina sp. J07AB43]
MRYAAVTLITLLSVSAVGAQQVTGSSSPENVLTDSGHLNLSYVQEKYNSRSGEVPDIVGSIIGDQTITVNLTRINDSEKLLKEDVIGVKTNGVRTEEIRYGTMQNPTLKIWITQQNIDRLSNAEDRQKELKRMIQNKDIRYETKTLGTAVKMAVMNFFISL